jgi:ATP-dependent DNA helicase RecG
MSPETPLEKVFRLSEPHAAALRKLGIRTARDLLYHFPARWERAGDESQIAGLASGQDVSIIGTLEKLEAKKGWKSRIPMTEGYLRDSSGRIKCRWFNQPYIAKLYAEGTLVKATGKVSGSEGKLYLANPQLQKVSATEAGLFAGEGKLHDGHAASGQGDRQGVSSHPLFAVYPETRGVTSLWMRHAVKKILDAGVLERMEDPLPAPMLKKYNLPTLRTALVWLHQPQELADAQAARKRFAFEEIFLIQLALGAERAALAREKSFVINVPEARMQEFVDAFPFSPTHAQLHAIEAILKDMGSGSPPTGGPLGPMSRLLEGDVGSGKTAVAAAAAYAVVASGLQIAYMAPTELLAKQHFESFIKFFEHFPINIGLITGSGCYKFPSKINREKFTNISRAQLLKWIAGGEIPVVIGTHALIQKSVVFKHLALVIIDEQHRFGTNQRRQLTKKDAQLPHLLSMTATPIPRTLALTVWGDLDLTLLDEMPAGRKQIITEIVDPKKRAAAYEKIRAQLAEGRQAYVICPRIDEPDPDKAFALQAKSVKAEAKRLKKDVFPEFEIDILHSKMTPKEKDATMAKFLKHETDILVATSVVEVGVNIPNATVILIEGAERFGLSQLHQLRGRVVRSTLQAYCFVVPESKGEMTVARLKALTTAKNGFELAEQDLMQRGPGELSGRKQWGISDVGMEAIKNLKLVEAARTEAQSIIKSDPHLKNNPLLAQEVAMRSKQQHLE